VPLISGTRRLDRWVPLAYLAGLIIGILAVLGIEGAPIQPTATSWLTIPVKGTRGKPPVLFNHRGHETSGVACTQCHHEYRGKRNVWQQGQPVQKCLSCHGLTPQAQRLDLKNAMHRQCKGCHLKLRQQGRKAGPLVCLDCHRRS
jgi:hypothetical protein